MTSVERLLDGASCVGLRAEAFYAALFDGRAQLIPQATAAETLRRLFNRHDGVPAEAAG